MSGSGTGTPSYGAGEIAIKINGTSDYSIEEFMGIKDCGRINEMRVIRLIVNWLIALLSPIWILPAFLFMIFKGVYKDQYCVREHFFKGIEWMWE